MNSQTPEILPQENFIILEDNHADSHAEEVVLDENTIILAAGDTYSLIDMAALRAAVKRSGLSYEDIAEATDISVSSIYKFFSKKSKSPSFFNVLMIFRAIGASVDDICGIHPKKKQPTPEECRERLSGMERSIAAMEQTMQSQAEMIKQLTAELRLINPASHDDY